MMHIGIIDEERRNMSLMNYIMQSEQDANKIIKKCEELIAIGYNPTIVIEQACRTCNININNLSDVDKQKIIKKVNEICHSKQTRRDK